MKKKWLYLILPAIALLIVLHILVVRPYYMHWGATKEECAKSLAGDALINKYAIVSTRAITINAPAKQVWPWIIQIGQGRGGYYTYSWLENLFATQMVNAERIVPEFQRVKIGDPIYFHRKMPPAKIALIEYGKTFVLTGGWTFRLEQPDSTTTRFIVRYPFPVKTFGDKLYYYSIFEPAHFLVEAEMMMGIKQRSEKRALGSSPYIKQHFL